MQVATSKQETRNSNGKGVVYRTLCQNPGCGFTFDLRITPETASMLSGPIACPRCRRHGGSLKPQGRLGDKLFGAKLMFRATGVETRMAPEDEDVFAGSRY
jgi:hypothetical protein